MSFYGTSYYEFKQFFKRFIFKNKDDTQVVFDPEDLFDHLIQKGDHWINFSEGEESLPDGTKDKILLISHNIPNNEEAIRSGLRFFGDYDLFEHTNHEYIISLVNLWKDKKTELTEIKDELEEKLNTLFYDCKTNDENVVQHYLDFLGIKAEEIIQNTEAIIDSQGDSKTIYWKSAIGPFLNTNYEQIEYIADEDIEIIRPGTIASIPNFDLDAKGHIVLKGNNCFTFPDTVIGFIGPDGEIVKVGASDNPDGSYVYFTGNGYIDFSFDSNTGALSINHKEGSDADIERTSAMPIYFNTVQDVIDYLNKQLEEQKKEEGDNIEFEPLTKEDVKIQSFRSGNVLQIPNFKYDKYGHMVQDSEDPYNYYSLDMADAYTIKNFTVVFDKIITKEQLRQGESGWVLYQGYEDLYYKEIPFLSQMAYTDETVFNTACDNITRLILIDKGINEFWVDNEKGKAIMYIRGDLSSILNPEDEYAFQVQIVNSYNASNLPLGINGTVIVFLSEITASSPEEATGICSHTCQEIIDYLSIGKMVLCLDKATQEYYVPYKISKDVSDDLSHVIFTKVTNTEDDNIVSTKVTINNNQAYIKSVHYNFKSAISNSINQAIAPFIVSITDETTLHTIESAARSGVSVYYKQNSSLIPLSTVSQDYAIFTANIIENGVLKIYAYIVDNEGKVTTKDYSLSSSQMLPSGGTKGQILMINDNGIPQWTDFLRINTNDDNLIEYYNANSTETNKWEPVSASWA